MDISYKYHYIIAQGTFVINDYKAKASRQKPKPRSLPQAVLKVEDTIPG